MVRDFELGEELRCEMRGAVTVVAISDSPVAWPMTRWRRGPLSPILCGDLVKAVRQESNLAVRHHWGVTPQTVSKWRKALGVGQSNAGTRRLRQAWCPEFLD